MNLLIGIPLVVSFVSLVFLETKREMAKSTGNTKKAKKYTQWSNISIIVLASLLTGLIIHSMFFN